MSKNIFIKEYRKEGSNIIIKKTNKEEDKIFNTPANEQKVIEQMEKDINTLLDNELVCVSGQKIKSRTITTLLWSSAVILGCITIIRHSIDPSLSAVSTTLFSLDAVMFSISAGLLELEKYLKNFKEKYTSFFRNEKKLNKEIKKYPSLIDNVNKKAKEEIENNMADGMENPINVNSIRLVKLKELRSMIDKLEFYQDLDIETAQDVIDDYNGNLEELSKKYDSVEVEKPKMKKHLLRRL